MADVVSRIVLEGAVKASFNSMINSATQGLGKLSDEAENARSGISELLSNKFKGVNFSSFFNKLINADDIDTANRLLLDFYDKLNLLDKKTTKDAAKDLTLFDTKQIDKLLTHINKGHKKQDLSNEIKEYADGLRAGIGNSDYDDKEAAAISISRIVENLMKKNNESIKPYNKYLVDSEKAIGEINKIINGYANGEKITEDNIKDFIGYITRLREIDLGGVTQDMTEFELSLKDIYSGEFGGKSLPNFEEFKKGIQNASELLEQLQNDAANIVTKVLKDINNGVSATTVEEEVFDSNAWEKSVEKVGKKYQQLKKYIVDVNGAVKEANNIFENKYDNTNNRFKTFNDRDDFVSFMQRALSLNENAFDKNSDIYKVFETMQEKYSSTKDRAAEIRAMTEEQLNLLNVTRKVAEVAEEGTHKPESASTINNLKEEKKILKEIIELYEKRTQLSDAYDDAETEAEERKIQRKEEKNDEKIDEIEQEYTKAIVTLKDGSKHEIPFDYYAYDDEEFDNVKNIISDMGSIQDIQLITYEMQSRIESAKDTYLDFLDEINRHSDKNGNLISSDKWDFEKDLNANEIILETLEEYINDIKSASADGLIEIDESELERANIIVEQLKNNIDSLNREWDFKEAIEKNGLQESIDELMKSGKQDDLGKIFQGVKDGVLSTNEALEKTKALINEIAVEDKNNTLKQLFKEFYNTESYAGKEEQIRALNNGKLLQDKGINYLTTDVYGRGHVDRKANNIYLPKNMTGFDSLLHTHPFSESRDNLRFSFGDISEQIRRKVQEAILMCGEEVLQLQVDPDKVTEEIKLKWKTAQNAIYAKFGAVIGESGKIIHEFMTDDQKNMAAQLWNSYLEDEVSKLGGSLTSLLYDRKTDKLVDNSKKRIAKLSKDDSKFIEELSFILDMPDEDSGGPTDSQYRDLIRQYQKKNTQSVNPLSFASDDEIKEAFNIFNTGDLKKFGEYLDQIQAKYKKVTESIQEGKKAVQENAEAERKYANLTDKELDKKIKDAEYSVKNNKDWLKYIDKFDIDEDKKLGKKKATDYLRYATKRLARYRTNPKDIEFAGLNMREEDVNATWMKAWKIAQNAGVAESTLNRYKTDLLDSGEGEKALKAMQNERALRSGWLKEDEEELRLLQQEKELRAELSKEQQKNDNAEQIEDEVEAHRDNVEAMQEEKKVRDELNERQGSQDNENVPQENVNQERIKNIQKTATEFSNAFKKLNEGSLEYQKILDKKNSGQALSPDEIVQMQDYKALFDNTIPAASEFVNAINSSSDALKEEKEIAAQVNAEIEKYNQTTERSINAINESKKMTADIQASKKREAEQKEQKDEQKKIQEEQVIAQENKNQERIKNVQRVATEFSNAFKELDKGSLEYQKLLDKNKSGEFMSPDEIVKMENYKKLLDGTLPSAFEFIDAINSSSNALKEEQEIASQVNAEIEKYNQTTEQSVNAINKSKKMALDAQASKDEKARQKEQEKAQKALEKQRVESAKQAAKDIINIYEDRQKNTPKYLQLKDKQINGELLSGKDIQFIKDYENQPNKASLDYKTLKNRINKNDTIFDGEREAIKSVDDALNEHNIKIKKLKEEYRIDKANGIAKNVNNLYNQLDKGSLQYQKNIAKRDAGEVLNAKELKQISDYESKFAEVTKILSDFEESILSNKNALKEEVDVVESLQKRREQYSKNINDITEAVKKEREDKQKVKDDKQAEKDANALLRDQNKRAKKASNLYDKATSLETGYREALQVDEKDRSKTQTNVINKYTEAVKEAMDIQKQLASEGFPETEAAWGDLINAANKYKDSLNSAIEKQITNIGDELENFDNYTYKTDVAGYDEFIETREAARKKLDSLSHNKEIIDMSDPDSAESLVAMERVKQDAVELDKIMNKLRNDSRGFIDTGSVSEFSSEINDLKIKIGGLLNNKNVSGSLRETLKGFVTELDSGVVPKRLDEIGGQVDNLGKRFNRVGNDAATFTDRLKTRFQSLGTYLATFVSFYQVVNVVKEIATSVREFDDALTEMRKVSNESVDTLKEYQKQSFDMAKSIGTDALSLQNSTADFMRLGQSLEEAKDSAMSANVLMNVSEFESIDQATDSLIAMKSAYKDLDNMQIIDKLNEVGNNMPIATAGLATALQDSAGALTTANNSIDESIALITAGNAITQDPSKTGKGIRTIALRLTGTEEAKAELEEIGEDTENVITTQSKLRSTVMEATKVASNGFKGFDILNPNGSYKSTYEIMLGIADIWQEIKENDEKYGTKRSNLLLESIAGKNRANIASSILESPDLLRGAFEYSAEANGSAMRENEKYLDSITGKLNQLKTAYQELGVTAVDSDFLKVLTDMGTVGVEGLTKYIDEFGTLKALFPVVTGFVGALGGGMFHFDRDMEFSTPIINAFKKTPSIELMDKDNEFIKNVIEKGLVGSAANFDDMSDSIKGVNTQLLDFAQKSETVEGFKDKVNVATGAVSKASTVFKTFGASLLNIGLNFAAGLAISAAINLVMKAVDDVFHAREHIQEAMDTAQSSIDEANQSFESQSSSIENIKKRYAELAEGVKVTSSEIKNMNLSDEEFSEYLNLNKQLSEIAPDLASGYDTQGNALIKLGDGYNEVTNNIDDYIEKLREARNLEVAGNMEDLFTGVKTNVSDLEKQSDEILEVKNNIENAAKTGFTFNNKDYEYYRDILKQLGISEEDQVYQFSGQTSSIQVKETAASILESGEAVSNAIAVVNARYGKDYKNLIEGTNALKEQQQKEWQSVSEEMLQSIQAGEVYQDLKLKGQDAINAFQGVFNNLDFGAIINNNGFEKWSDFQGWVENNLITPISTMSPQINDALDMREAFDNNKVTVQEYINTLSDLFESDLFNKLPKEVQDALHSAFTYTSEDGKNVDQMMRNISNTINAGIPDAFRDNKSVFDYLGNLSKEDLELALEIVQPGMTIDELQSKIEETKEQAAEGVDLNARTNLEGYNKAKEAGGSYLKDYESYRDMIKSAQELRDAGRIGNEEFKAAAKALSVNGMSDYVNFDENVATLGKYFTEDATQGLQVFLNDLQALPDDIADVSQNAAGEWDINFTDMEESAKRLYMPLEMLDVLLDGLSEYGFTGDYFTTPEQGMEHLNELLQEQADAEAKLKQMREDKKNGILPDANGNAIAEQEKLVEQLGEQADSTREKIREMLKAGTKKDKQDFESAKELSELYKNEFKNLDKTDEAYEYMATDYLKRMQELASTYKITIPIEYSTVDNPNITTNINKSGKIQMDVVVNNEEDLEAARQAMETIPEEKRSDVVFNYDVQNPELLDKTQKQANEFATDYQATVSVKDNASKTIKHAAELIDNYDKKQGWATIGVNDHASSTLNSIIDKINNKLHDKTVDITTRMTTVKRTIFGSSNNGNGSGKAVGTTGFVSSHATGTVLGGMKAYFGGHNIALSEDQKALVGEEGMEGLVRDGQFYLIGENSPEIRDLKKGDIIFSAKQTKAILNGQKTSRGKTIGMASHADGTANVLSKGYVTAFADGLLNAYAGKGSGSGSFVNKSSSSSSSSKSSSSSTKATNNNTKAVKENTKEKKKGNTTQKKTNASLESLQKKWDNLEDWIDDWIAAWDRTYNEYELYANEIHQNFGKQNAYVEKMYSHINKINKNYSNMYTKYMRQAAASGLSSNYVKKVQGNTINIESISDEKLKAQIEEYKRWYDLAQNVRTKIIELRAEQSKLADQKLTNIQDDYDNLANISSNTLDYWKQAISLRRTLGRSYNSAIDANGTAEMDGRRYYSSYAKNSKGKKVQLRSRKAADNTDYNTNLTLSYGYALDAQKSILNAHKNEYKKLNKEFNSLVKRGKIKKNDDVWKSWTANLKELETQIYADKEAFAQLREELMDYYWEGFNKNIETIEYSLKEFNDILGHINENNLFSKEGKLTKDGLGYIGTISLALGEANQELVNYQSAIKTLEQQYKKGNISQEKYTEKLREYLDVIRDTSNSIDDYKDKLVDLYMNQMKAENETLKENISLRQENLKRLREYDSYAKTIKTKNKDINAMQAQIASLSGVNTQEGRAELARLRAQLKEAQEDLADTQQEHRWDMMDQGYSDMAEKADKTLEEVTDKLERSTKLQTEIVNKMLNTIKTSYETTYADINKIVTDSGIALSNKTETDINRLSTKGGAKNAIDKAEGTVSYNNKLNKSTGTVKPDSVTTNVKTTVELKSLKLNKTSVSVNTGKTVKLTATKDPTSAQGAITWSSSNTKIATVNKGTVKGVAVGSVTITATCQGKTATCKVKVTKVVGKGKVAPTKTIANTTKTTNDKRNKVTETKKTSAKNTVATNISNGNLAIRQSAGNKQKALINIPKGGKAKLVLDSSGRYQTKKADNLMWIKATYGGKTGWTKLKYLKYAKGSKKIKEDQIGITQDAGAEMIMSRGRMLVPTQLFKGDTVYPNDITEKLWDIGKLGIEGIKENIERDLQIKIPNGLNGLNGSTENNFGDYNVTINALQKLDRKEIQQLSDYFYNDWYKRMKKDLAVSGIKR